MKVYLHDFDIEDVLFKTLDKELVIVSDYVDRLSLINRDLIDYLFMVLFIVRIHLLININNLCEFYL